MKKVITMLLAVILVASLLPMSAFAAPAQSPIIGFSGPSGDGTADILDNRKVKDFGQLILGETKTVLEVPIKIENMSHFATDTGVIASESDITKDVMDRMEIKFSNETLEKIFAKNYEKHHSTPVEHPRFILTGMNIGVADGYFWVEYSRKELDGSVVVYKSMDYDIYGEFLDPTINKHITAIRDDELTAGKNFATNSNSVTYNGKTIWSYDDRDTDNAVELTKWLSNLVVYPGDEIAFYLHSDHFVWDPDIKYMRSSVRKSSLDNDFVDAIKTVIEGDGKIAKVNFENKTGKSVALVVKFTDDYPKLQEKDFIFNIALGMNGVRNTNSEATLVGSFGNPIYEVYEDNDYVFVGDGMVAEAMNNVRNIEFDLDNGVSLFANLTEDSRYYGKSSVLPTGDDKDIMNYFVSIRKAITLTTNKLDKATRSVRLNEEALYYVYDADGLYIGKTTEALPYRTKYYLSTTEIDFNLEEMEDPEDIDEMYDDDDNPETGGMSPMFTSVLSLVGLASLGLGTLFLGDKSKKNRGRK